MKKLYILFCILFFVNPTIAQRPSISWASYYAGALTSFDRVIYEPICECIYAVGYTADSNEVASLGAFRDYMYPVPVPALPILIDLWRTDAFLAKFDLNGNRIWATYFGGWASEISIDISADKEGNIYIASNTVSNDGIATAGSLHPSKLVDTNVVSYITKFSPAGAVLWSSYYNVYSEQIAAETGASQGQSFVVNDTANNVYLAGTTEAAYSIGTIGAYQPTYSGYGDVFISKFDQHGIQQWASYYGGNNGEFISSMEMGADGYLYIAGKTNSVNQIATPGTYMSAMVGSDTAGFIMKINPSNGYKVWGTYIDDFYISNMDIDRSGNIYIYGSTYLEGNIATMGTYQDSIAGDMDMVIMKFNNSGNKVWGTFYGGPDLDTWLYSNAFGSIVTYSNLKLSPDQKSFYIVGNTNSSTGIDNGCGFNPTTPNKRGFLSKFDTTGNLLYSGYYDAEIHHIDVSADRNGVPNIYFVGRTTIDGLATVGSHKSSKSTAIAGLIGKFVETCPDITLPLNYEHDTLITDAGYDSYTWYHNGISVYTGSEAYYVPGTDTIGNYYVVGEQCGCQYTSDTFNFRGIGLYNPMFTKDIKVYPNPSNAEISITSLNNTIDFSHYQVQIFNAMGQAVPVKFINKAPGQMVLAVADFPAGIYAISISNEIKNYQIKFIKY